MSLDPFSSAQPGVAPSTAAPPARACPQCRAPMLPLSLPCHLVAAVVVDHCRACRLVWFDALESVKLSGVGWTRLLREMQRAQGSAMTAARPPQLQCVACGDALKPVHNRTRFGHFPALECPRRHGHLHSHAGLLAERGLVRPLLPPERQALQREQRVLHCFNCGARCEGDRDACSYCASPLLVIDLPRLTHALLTRPSDLDRLPTPQGTPLAWPCHACGQALDPSRDAVCPQCGHGVVAPSTIDLSPLLNLVESRQQQAELAARPYARKRRAAAFDPEHSWRETQLSRLRGFWRSLFTED